MRVGEEDEGVEAEAMDTSARRAGAYGRGYGGARVCSRESQGRGWVEEVSEGVPGGVWRHPKRPGRSGKQEVAGAASALATPCLCPSGEGGRRQGREAAVGWAGTEAGPAVLQVSAR